MIRDVINKIIGTGMQAKIAKGVVWSFMGVLISRGFIFLAYVLISKVTSLEQYGEIGILKSVITTFSMFSLASFGITATRYIAIHLGKDKNKVEKILSLTYFMTILISVVIFILIIVFSKSFAIHVLGNENLQLESSIAAFAILFSALNGFQFGVLGGLERFRSISIVNIINGIISFPILFFATKYYDVLGFSIGLSCVYFILYISSAVFLRKGMLLNGLNFTVKNLKTEFKILQEFSIPSFLSGFIVSPTILFCNTLLVKTSSGFVQMGIYDAAFNFAIIAMTFNGVVGQVTYPYAMKMHKKNNKSFDFFNLSIPWLTGIFFGVFLIYIPDIFSLIFDERFQNQNMYKTVASISLFVIFISHRQGISRNLAAINKMWYGFLDNLIWSIIAITTAYFLIEYGAFGRAFSFVIAYAINSIIILPIYLKMNVFKKDFILSKESILIWGIVFLSYSTVFYDFNIYLRLFLLFSTLLILSVISYKWYRKQRKISHII
ncbi:MAG: oligosaccharide flippase family protein [Flavobacteriaceae bacterium]|nr:oligosaccharide flippase family protein [Flavobacteriaceae bacterium]